MNSSSLTTPFRPHVYASAFLFAMCGAVSAQSSATRTVVDAQASGHEGSNLHLIVKTSHILTSNEERLFGRYGAFVYRHLPLIHSIAVSVPTSRLAQLTHAGFVNHVSSDAIVRKTDAYTVSASYANVAWSKDNVSGKGIGVAIVDSGIRASADFGSRVVANMNFSPDATSADDLCGHGTQVAGIVAGSGSNSYGPKYSQTYYGIAPQANLINIRVLDSQGSGSVSQVIAGISWAVANKSLYKIT